MMTKTCIIALDQGTTSSRAIAFDHELKPIAVAQQEFTQHYPADGWVEHDLEEIWSTTVTVTKTVLSQISEMGYQCAALGITNQRETTAVWDRSTGEPMYKAIVWQDRRTADVCQGLRQEGLLEDVNSRSGLLLDPYFSSTKVAWILDKVEGARAKAENGELAFGTIDTFLIWRLTQGQRHVTDATNASRTNLFNINTLSWDDALLDIFQVPSQVLPEVLDCSADFGVAHSDVLGAEIPIYGVAGDQQAATVGQGCFTPGSIKSTYGTGCFVLINSGDEVIYSKNNLLSTVAYQLDGKATYALEGSIFIAGAVVQWLRDGIKIIDHAKDTQGLAESLDSNSGVYMVPAFTGLGAPHWDPDARGAIFGITRGTGRNEIVRAALESVCYQTYDLLSAMADDGVTATSLKVDGGMVANDWVMQFLADILNIPLERPDVLETTAKGAAYLAGMRAGVYGSPDEFAASLTTADHFAPRMDEGNREDLLVGWRKAIARVVG
ncbi:MAG: glycerol kinase GlpK [Pseudomonadota bacterium]